MEATVRPFTPVRIFILVTAGALAGMLMGATFGFGAGNLTPSFFAHFIPWNDVEPVGFATVVGVTGGLFLGGGLAVFSLVLHLLLRGRAHASEQSGFPK